MWVLSGCLRASVELREIFLEAVLPRNGTGRMKKGTDKTDTFPGVLRGKGEMTECKCTVALVTKLIPGKAGNAVSTSLRIDSGEQSPPDGNYRLDVRGRIFNIRRVGGEWPVLAL